MGGGVLVRGEGWCRWRSCWRERTGVGRSKRTRFIWAIGGRSVGGRGERREGGGYRSPDERIENGKVLLPGDKFTQSEP